MQLQQVATWDSPCKYLLSAWERPATAILLRMSHRTMSCNAAAHCTMSFMAGLYTSYDRRERPRSAFGTRTGNQQQQFPLAPPAPTNNAPMQPHLAAALLPLLLLALAPLRGASAAWDGTVKCYLGFINDTTSIYGPKEQCLPDPVPFRTLAASTNAMDK